MTEQVTGALTGIRVLDLSRVLAGPWCGQLLADLGAEVIKVERPGTGDDTRGWGPPFLADAAGTPTRESAYYLCANRGKRSLAVDLADPQGQALVRDLAARSDVVIENFKVGGLARYGLDYDSLAAANPGIVYCSITGFGQDGPYASRPGYDVLIQAMGGLMSLTGQPDGSPGAEPMKTGVAVADLFTGVYASTAILAALRHRDRTGEGQYIDMALLDVQVSMLANQASNYLVGETVPRRAGNAHPNIVPYQVFATADGHMVLAVGNDGQFRRFCDVAGLAGYADDPAFATNTARVAHRGELVPVIAERLARGATAEWVSALQAAGVPCGPINTMDAVFADPQVRHRGMQVRVPHEAGGHVDLVRCPIRMSATPPRTAAAPPQLGEHTRAVLADELGLDDAAIARLVEAGIVQG